MGLFEAKNGYILFKFVSSTRHPVLVTSAGILVQSEILGSGMLITEVTYSQSFWNILPSQIWSNIFQELDSSLSILAKPKQLPCT